MLTKHNDVGLTSEIQNQWRGWNLFIFLFLWANTYIVPTYSKNCFPHFSRRHVAGKTRVRLPWWESGREADAQDKGISLYDLRYVDLVIMMTCPHWACLVDHSQLPFCGQNILIMKTRPINRNQLIIVFIGHGYSTSCHYAVYRIVARSCIF